MLSNHARKIYKRTRYELSKDTWPPEQPENFTPVLLMHHQGHRSLKETNALTETIYSLDLNDVVFATNNQYIITQHPKLKFHVGCFQKFLNTSKVTKDVKEILVPLEESEDPQLILIEGAPGMGKTILLKEIAVRWSKDCSLLKFKLVLLLYLRDQHVQQLSSVEELFDYFSKYNRISVEAVTDYFFRNDGKDILFLLDGYDELPIKMREDSLVASIIKRHVFPDCGLIISSRPHASVHLRQQATCRIDILGFTEDEKRHFIHSSLKGQSELIIELTHYLNNHSSVNNLCRIPFNMAVLLFLYKQQVPLPRNSTELYNLFICLTVCCHLAKYDSTSLRNFTSIASLPRPYYQIIYQLSTLSLKALDINRLVFTLEEVKQFCPEIEAAVNGFGILQAVEHFGISCSIKTFNFVHFSIQEYLAAYYVAHLPPNEELEILQQKFWSNTHSNMFSMYVALTKGQHSAFKQFLSDGSCTVRIASKFLDDQLKCLRLFKCFYEAEDEEMYSCIENAPVFYNKCISLRFKELSPNDIECLGLFLTASSINKHWKALNLTSCYLQDYDIRTFHHAVVGTCSPSITIEAVDLPANFITSSSDSCVSDLVIKCSIKSLGASGNKSLGETIQFYNMISHPLSQLEQLWLGGNRLTTTSAIFLFKSLRNPNQLRSLVISDNMIDDGICNDVIATLQVNTTLKRLLMTNNPISKECAHKIIDCLSQNNTLSWLWFPAYADDVIGAMKIKQEKLNESRRNEYQTELELRFMDI